MDGAAQASELRRTHTRAGISDSLTGQAPTARPTAAATAAGMGLRAP